MNYPYQRLFLDIRLAKERLEEALDPACGVDANPRLTEACLTEPFYVVTKEEAARPISSAVAIQQMRPAVGRSIFAKVNSSGEPAQMCLLRNCKCS
jgi:hypothetical protein